MSKSPTLPLIHLYDAVERLDWLLGRTSVEDLQTDWLKRAAAERMLSILSEASRRLRPEWKASFPDVPWSRIAGLGNVIRHDYDQLDPAVFIGLQTDGHLQLLRTTVEALLDEIEPEWRRLRAERTGCWP